MSDEVGEIERLSSALPRAELAAALESVPGPLLVTALKSLPQGLRDDLLRALPPRRALLLLEELGWRGAVAEDDAAAARRALVEALGRARAE